MRTQKRLKLRPDLWYQTYWILYLVWFFLLDWWIQEPKYIIYSPLDEYIPFCEWFIFPYCSWFFLLAGVTALLWWYDPPAYKKLCLMMFSGMTFCLVVYMIWPNGLDLRPAADALGRDNLALRLMELIWRADSPNNVCPSIHCQSSGCMALAFAQSRLGRGHPGRQLAAYGWAGLICLSTVLTKQHSVIDVFCGLALAAVWYWPLYRPALRAKEAV